MRTQQVATLLGNIGSVTMLAVVATEWSKEQLSATADAFRFAGLIKYRKSPIRGIKERGRQLFDPRFLNSNGVDISPEDRSRTEELINAHDLVWIHTMKVANAYRKYHWTNSVMDVDDIPSRYNRLAAPHEKSLKRKVRRWYHAHIDKRRETFVLDRFSIVTVCKESDRVHFQNDERVHVVPNGFATPVQCERHVIRAHLPILGMIGDFGHLPNAEGFRWFARTVWPRIMPLVPDATVRLVGKGSREIAAEYEKQRIVGVGYVDDTSLELATWAGMIVPTRLGGGSHLKVVEGLARRVAMVTTSHGSRGYDLINGRHAFVADTEDAFGDACLKLLQNPLIGAGLAADGWSLFRTKYAWNAIAPAVEGAVEHCLSRSKNTQKRG